METAGPCETSVDLNQTTRVRSQKTSPYTLLRTRGVSLFLELSGCDVKLFSTLRALWEWVNCVLSHNKTAHGAPLTAVHGCYQAVLYFQNIIRFKVRPTSAITLMPMILIDWLTLGSNPYGHDVPRPYRPALFAP